MAEVRRGVAGMLPHQLALLADDHRVRVLQGGYRSGKTVAGVAAVLQMGWRNGGHPVLAVEPTYRMAMDVFVATARRMLSTWKVPHTWHKSDKILSVGGRGAFDVLCRSADNPRSLEGLTVCGALIDEWELIDPEALGVAMARVSVGPWQRVVLTGTPEGYGPCWSMVLKDPAPDTRVWVVASAANTTLASTYVAGMAQMLDDVDRAEKLEGNRTQKGGRVYTRFDRAVHLGTPCVDRKRPGVVLELWCDFNVGAHCWLLVEVDHATGCAHVVREIIGYETDTAEHAQTALGAIADHLTATTGRRYTREDVRDLHLEAPCDASARNRGALASHAAILREAGFRPRYSSRGNPAVEDRVVSVQMRLADRKLTVDPQRAPRLAEALEQQGRDPSGSPAKHADPRRDHSGPADALGYGIFWHWPAFRLRANGESERRAQAERDARDRDAQQAAERWRGVIT